MATNTIEENKSSTTSSVLSDITGLLSKSMSFLKLLKFNYSKYFGIASIPLEIVSNSLSDANANITQVGGKSMLSLYISSIVNNKLKISFYYFSQPTTSALTRIYISDSTSTMLWNLIPATNLTQNCHKRLAIENTLPSTTTPNENNKMLISFLKCDCQQTNTSFDFNKKSWMRTKIR